MIARSHKSLAQVISELVTIAILGFGMLGISFSRSCEREKAQDIESCKARHLLGETNQYHQHLGCLRKAKTGHWEKVKDL